MFEGYYEEPEPTSVSYERYIEQVEETEKWKDRCHHVEYRLDELSSYAKEVSESDNYEEKLGEFYEWCKENKYF